MRDRDGEGGEHTSGEQQIGREQSPLHSGDRMTDEWSSQQQQNGNRERHRAITQEVTQSGLERRFRGSGITPQSHGQHHDIHREEDGKAQCARRAKRVRNPARIGRNARCEPATRATIHRFVDWCRARDRQIAVVTRGGLCGKARR